MQKTCTCVSLLLVLPFCHTRLSGQQTKAPEGIKQEGTLPSRYPYVVQDMLKYCNPEKGFWIDLGAGKGQVSIPLIEATGNPVIMVDPNAESMMKGLTSAREKGLKNKLFAVVGVAEDLPFPDNSVDWVVSRGAIFFFDDPAKGLAEVYRVLRPGGKAYIGGGAGSGYPEWATKRLIDKRQKQLEGDDAENDDAENDDAENDDAEKWKRFVDLRRPEQMRQWAEKAGLPQYKIMGKGAISAEDKRVGQGEWILFEKRQDD